MLVHYVDIRRDTSQRRLQAIKKLKLFFISLIKYFKEFFKLIVEKKYTTLSGAISFFIIVNGASVIFVSIVLFQNLDIDITVFESRIVSFPDPIYKVFSSVLSSSIELSGYSVIFVITSLWGASNLFYQMIQAGEIIYNMKRPTQGIFKRCLAILMMLIIVFLLAFLVIFLALTNTVLANILKGSQKVINVLSAVLIPLFLLLFLNMYIPPYRLKVKEAFLGAFFTTVYWYLATFIFFIYITFSKNLGALYGSLAFVLVFMMWINLLTKGLFIGFIINYRYHKKYRLLFKKGNTI